MALGSVPSQVGREVGADIVEGGLPTSAVSPVDRTKGNGAEGFDAGAQVVSVPSRVGREVGADTVEVDSPTLVVSPVDQTEKAGAEGVDARTQVASVPPPGRKGGWS